MLQLVDVPRQCCPSPCLVVSSVGVVSPGVIRGHTHATAAVVLGRMQWCHTDLGANALSWPRLMREDRRLGAMEGDAGELAADHFDGVLAQTLLDAGAPSLAATGKAPLLLYIGVECSLKP